MRAAALALVAVFGVMALPAPVSAAPTAPHQTAIVGEMPDLLQVRGGCGPGWHPRAWRDRWGYWQRRCVPNRW